MPKKLQHLPDFPGMTYHGAAAVQRVALPISAEARAQRARPLLPRQVHRGVAQQLLKHGDSLQATEHHGAAGATGSFLHLSESRFKTAQSLGVEGIKEMK